MSAEASKIPVVLIGLGNRGREHMEYLLDVRSPFHLVGVVEPLREKRESAHLPAGVDSAAAWHELKADYSAAVIAVPPHHYADLIPQLLEAGAHLLVEKPLGLTLSEALAWQELADSRGLVMRTGVQRRFHKSYQAWKLHSDLPGVVLECLIRIDITHRPSGWRLPGGPSGGGALFDLGFHAVDLALQIFGDLRLVSACFFDEEGKALHDRDDMSADLLLEAEQGEVVRIEVGRGRENKLEEVVVRGTKGRLVMNRAGVHFTDTHGCGRQLLDCPPGWDAAMHDQLTSWAEAIHSHAGEAGEEGWAGLVAMRIMEEAYARAPL